MSKTLCHVIVPYTTTVTCGKPSHYINSIYRDQVTCKACRKTEWFKKLPTQPRKFRKGVTK